MEDQDSETEVSAATNSGSIPMSRTNSYLHLPVYSSPPSVESKFSNQNKSSSYRWRFLATSYLVICIVISAIYVAIYAENTFYYPEDYLAYLRHKQNSLLKFNDLPYTEWIATRWTFSNRQFANWPQLPEMLSDNIVQAAEASLANTKGVWLLGTTNLVYVSNLATSTPGLVQFTDVSANLGIEIVNGSRLAVEPASGLYIISPTTITRLNCSQGLAKDCYIASKHDNQNLNSVLSATVSLSDGALWIGTVDGLHVAAWEQGQLVVRKVENVTGAVSHLAWRSLVTQGNFKSSFILCNAARNPHLSFSDGSKLVLSKTFSVGDYLQLATPEEPSEDSALLGMSKIQFDHVNYGYVNFNAYSTPVVEFGLLVVAADYKLYFFDGSQWRFEWVSRWEDGLGGVVDGPVTSMTFTSDGSLFIANNVSISRLNSNYTFERIGPEQRLPYNHINALFYLKYTPLYPPPTQKSSDDDEEDQDGGCVFIGTDMGYTIYDVATRQFRGYYFGPRWLPGDRVSAISGSTDNTVVVVTEGGVSFVHAEEWTLEAKALHYQKMLERHIREPGLVADCPLVNYTPSTCSPTTTDNDGLWTSWLVASEVFRYKVSGSNQAKNNAWRLFQGLEFLYNVTGKSGLMARSVVKSTVAVSGDTWHNSSVNRGWQWKGDTSSDEVVGHMFAYPIVYELLAKSSSERALVGQIINNIVGHIVSNGYKLIDVTGRPTRWGIWSPDQLNLNQSWADEHGVNSLQMLTFLLSAYHVTKNNSYWKTWKVLYNGTTNGVTNHYGLNMINQKVTFPRDDNFSDDELAFLPYFIYFFTLNNMKKSHLDVEPSETGLLSLQRTWQSVGPEKSSAWTAIYGYIMGVHSEEMIENVVWNLRTWPLELVEWETKNSHRLDIQFNPEQDR